jgi:hypothetical protein
LLGPSASGGGPSITSISGTPALSGASGSIVGTSFGATQGGVLLKNTSGSYGVIIDTWSDTLITFTTTIGTPAGTYDVVVVDSSNVCGSSSGGWVVTARNDTLNRQGIADTLRDMLKNDTTTLYGDGKLLEIIESDPSKFNAAKTEVSRPYGLFIWPADSDNSDTRMQNEDDTYSYDLVFQAINTGSKNAVDQIDRAWERVKVLVRDDMQNGRFLTDYYTDSNAQVINIDVAGSSLPAPTESTDERTMTFVCESAITVQINRF